MLSDLLQVSSVNSRVTPAPRLASKFPSFHVPPPPPLPRFWPSTCAVWQMHFPHQQLTLMSYYLLLFVFRSEDYMD